MTKHDEARERGELISKTMRDHFEVFTHPERTGYIEVAGDSQFWWIPTLDTQAEPGPEHYGETLDGLEWLLRRREQMEQPN